MVRATLGSVVFDGTADAVTYTIGDDGLDGWWDNVPTRTNRTPRPSRHGEFDSRGYLSGRVVTLTGLVLSTGPAAQENDLSALAGLLADGDTARLTVEGAAGSLWADVVRVDAPDVQVIVYGQTAAYQVNFLARDPRRYQDAAWVRTAPPSGGVGLIWPVKWPATWPGAGDSGRILLENTGKAPSAPMFRLLGGFDTALITCVETGSRIGLDRAVPPGSTVEIDTANRRAVIDGQSDVSRWLRWREWEMVPGGSSRSFQFDVTAPSGTPFLDGRVFPAWW